MRLQGGERPEDRLAPDEIARKRVVAGHVPRTIGRHHAEQRFDVARLERIVRGFQLERIGVIALAERAHRRSLAHLRERGGIVRAHAP